MTLPNFQMLRGTIPIDKMAKVGLDTSRLEEQLMEAAKADASVREIAAAVENLAAEPVRLTTIKPDPEFNTRSGVHPPFKLFPWQRELVAHAAGKGSWEEFKFATTLHYLQKEYPITNQANPRMLKQLSGLWCQLHESEQTSIRFDRPVMVPPWSAQREAYQSQLKTVEEYERFGRVRYDNPCAEILRNDSDGVPQFPNSELYSWPRFDSVVVRWVSKGVEWRRNALANRTPGEETNFCGVPVEVLEAEVKSRAQRAATQLLKDIRGRMIAPGIERVGDELICQRGADPKQITEATMKILNEQVAGLPTITCPDCKGSGNYVGLQTVEVCSGCKGRKVISAPEAKPETRGQHGRLYRTGEKVPAMIHPGSYAAPTNPKQFYDQLRKLNDHVPTEISFALQCIDGSLLTLPLRDGQDAKLIEAAFDREARHYDDYRKEVTRGRNELREIRGNGLKLGIEHEMGVGTIALTLSGPGPTIVYMKGPDGKFYVEFEGAG